ncbi:c-type cytochrome biogenesis protein CcmI/CycH [Pampinifervens florentissimum]|uniref:c-type cytochrome biogenesis protein CcmI/CycH n=1 Tax=Pampinifervens florentissimum TaxID=1632019 RepID=UPI0013B4986E|nr:hypothetical protein [Hydrogenobacter sp. T-8]QID33130.1 hypothetical protein G3M65_04820 [Hydrogenobacter sp. T-8]
MSKLFVFLASLLFACQPLPKEVPLEKYRNQFIEGEVVLDEALKDKVPKGKTFLIISVRDLENPMPLAVLRVKNPKLPYKFKITGKHKLSHDRIMEGQVIITARLSSSDKAEAQKGDLVGSTNAQVGTRGVIIKINSEVE